MIVDFHVHSKASDGTLDPSEIAYSAKAYSAIALTDHDNTDGIEEFLEAGETLAEDGRTEAIYVAGTELSIEPGAGFDRFHMLALCVDRENPRFKKLLAEVLEGRNRRNEKIIENFARIGIEISREDLAPYAQGEVLARPHFARLLADRGIVKDIAEGFEKYLKPDSPAATRCYEERLQPSQEEAFAAVHAAGGLCVMAHPKYWRRDWRGGDVDFAAARKELATLKDAGLDAIEAKYKANTPRENVEFTRIADELGFLKTAGSDFHGANKPSISMGMDVSETFIMPLIEALYGRPGTVGA